MYKAKPLPLSDKQRSCLTTIVAQHTCPQHIANRAQIILRGADGYSSRRTAEILGFDRETTTLWRSRWQAGSLKLMEAEQTAQVDDKQLTLLVRSLLYDARRSGTPPTFKPETVVQIVAIACEDPADSGRPISHWTAREIADEAVKRQLVRAISIRQVGRFLKRSRSQTAPDSVLATP